MKANAGGEPKGGCGSPGLRVPADVASLAGSSDEDRLLDLHGVDARLVLYAR